MQPARKLATFADLLTLSEDIRAEVIAGEIRALPPPLPEHGRAQRVLGNSIGAPFDDDDGKGGPGGWWILPEVDIQIGPHDVVRPDLAGWRRERLPSPWGKRPIEVVPDWICEVLSPSNEGHDRITKADLYARAGVPWYWIVSVHARTLEVWSLREGEWVRAAAHDDTATAAIPPFEAVQLEVGRIFPPLPAV